MPTTEEEMKAAQAQAEAEKAKEHEASAKADAEAGEKLDKVLEALDSLSSRMDAYEEEEGKRHEGEDEAEGEQGEEKHDAEGEEEKEEEDIDKENEEHEAEEGEEEKDVHGEIMEHLKEKEEEHKADSDDIRRRIAEVEKKLPKQVSDADYAAMADAQAKADEVFQAFGDAAPRPLDGESLILYRRRLARSLQKHSADWNGVDLVAIADTKAFDIAEKRIYADAMTAAMHPTDLPSGVLRMITRQRHPHIIHEFVGEPRAWMDDIAHPGGIRQGVSEIIRPNMGSRN